MRTFKIGGAAAIFTFGLLLAATLSHGEEAVRRFDIAAQDLSTALNEFALQSRQQILFTPGIVAQKISSPVHGELQPLAALKMLLKDSGLPFATTRNGAILVGSTGESRAASISGKAPGTGEPPHSAESSAGTGLATITVESEREREIVRRQVRNYVAAITAAPHDVSLGRWAKPYPLCPLVAGLPRADGEYMLKRLSDMATVAGAPLAPEHCKANFFVVVTSQPDELLKTWSNRDPWMFSDSARQGGTVIRKFLKASSPVRVWYNVAYTAVDGLSMAMQSGVAESWSGEWWTGGVRDLWSTIIVVDARMTTGVTFGQLAAYLAMVGLAQVRLDAKLGDAPTILQLFSKPEKAPPLGLSAWDESYLKALYHTQHERTQRLAVARTMVQEVAP
jgi:hypothetical protein